MSLSLTGERTLPGEPYWFARHEVAYRWVADQIRPGSRVLDAGCGECLLSRSDVREILIDRLCAEPSLDVWVIMPNHLHALVAPKDKTLGEVLQNWKGGSAFDINRLLGRGGPFWQKETYDHIVRSETQFRHYRRYIAENPLKARLEPHSYSVGFGQQQFKVASALAEALNP
jgi:REP element-mobilizing transposase RayT